MEHRTTLHSVNSQEARPGAARESSSATDGCAAWTNTRLVKECLEGNEGAWSALIDKYKNLIFSIPIKYGFSRDDASDVFQAVCLEMLSELPKLRKPEALPKWIMQVTAHKCFHRRREQRRLVSDTENEPLEQAVPADADAILEAAQEEQEVRRVLSELPPRCRKLIHMLFFEEPALPYADVANALGIATGSIGFIRQRCLDRLRKLLLEAGIP
jgi:RNA polymerase sigma factor (sigma-70 family)